MSYASEVKKELTGITVHRDNAKAELMALIRMNGSIGIADHQLVLNVQTEKLYYFTISILDEDKKKTLPIPSGKCSILIDKL